MLRGGVGGIASAVKALVMIEDRGEMKQMGRTQVLIAFAVVLSEYLRDRNECYLP